MKKIKYLILSSILLIGVIIALIYTWDVPAPTKVIQKNIDVNSEVSK